MSAKVSLQTYKLPEALAASVKTNIEDWRADGKVRRLWQHDASLWTGDDEANWLGWLDITEEQIAHSDKLRERRGREERKASPTSCCSAWAVRACAPKCCAMTFGKIAGFPELHVLDSTDPAQVKAFENKIDLAKTLFIVSSKSGSTLEPNIFKQYFFERVKQTVGADKAGSRFIAITDPGSKMQQVAEADHFRHIFLGLPSIGGRYSALSNFGMVPAAVMGIGHARSSSTAPRKWSRPAEPALPVDQNPGVVLGIDSRHAPRNGRDKVTIITSPGISDLGAWLEQLIAESTGKAGQGHYPGRSRRRSARPRFTATIACSPTCAWIPTRTRRRTPRLLRWNRLGIRSSASRSATFTISARNSSAGKSPPPSPDPSSASMPSTSPTSKPAKSPRAI